MTRRRVSDADRRAKSAARQRRFRDRARQAVAEAGAVIQVTLEAVELSRLNELCKARAVIGAPYSHDEFISTLIARDWERLQLQLAELEQRGPCKKCGSPLPGGCDGLFKGDAACYLTTDQRELML